LTTHTLISGVDTNVLESVEKGLSSVQSSLDICERAHANEEVKQLKQVQRKLQSHQGYLKQASNKPVSEQQLASLVQQGDPDCPAGQAYQYQSSGQKIRCSGPQLVDMNWRQVETYFTSRDYKLSKLDSKLRAEYGSESFTYSFARTEDENPASCLTMFGAPGIAWQEVVARATGVNPQALRKEQAVSTKQRKLALGLIEDQTQAIIKLGDCEK
jgi:hypothetical protein